MFFDGDEDPTATPAEPATGTDGAMGTGEAETSGTDEHAV